MSRSGGAGILAVCVLAGAWLLGSTALLILGLGLALATVAGRLWAQVVANALTISPQQLIRDRNVVRNLFNFKNLGRDIINRRLLDPRNLDPLNLPGAPQLPQIPGLPSIPGFPRR